MSAGMAASAERPASAGAATRAERPAADTSREASFTALLEPVLPRAYQAALHMTRNPADAEEIVQEAALLAYRGFDGFEIGTNFKAWFLRIVTNAFLMRCRKEKAVSGTISMDEDPGLYLYERTREAGLHGSEADPAAALFSHLATDEITGAIRSLPVAFRTVASLYFVEDLSYEEIAEIVGCPVGTVRSRLHRARALLQRGLWDLAVEHGLRPAGTGLA